MPKCVRSPVFEIYEAKNFALPAAILFLIGLGEELWRKFLPKYLESLGASVRIIGLFGAAEDLLDALYQYPGGWLADRLGRRWSFIAFILLAGIGYVLYLVSRSWPIVLLGLVFVMVWKSMAAPAVFAVIGDALPAGRRVLGFTVQAMLKRVPMIVSPIVGGMLIASLGISPGFKVALLLTLLLAACALSFAFALRIPVLSAHKTNIVGVWFSFHAALKRLLVSDIVIRTCEGLTDVLIVLYVTTLASTSIERYGVLVAIQTATSLVAYLPAGRLAGRIGKKPFVIATFSCFALFPLAIVTAESFPWLVVAFVIGGLREIGEPSRKAMILDLADPRLRARTVGLYYLVRGISVAPAAAVGGLLWTIDPRVPFVTAGIVGALGTLIFAGTVKEQYAT